MFIKNKSSIFYGAKKNMLVSLLLDCHEILYKIGIVEYHRVKFVTFLFQKDAKK